MASAIAQLVHQPSQQPQQPPRARLEAPAEGICKVSLLDDTRICDRRARNRLRARLAEIHACVTRGRYLDGDVGLASVDALARGGKGGLVLRLKDDVHNFEDGAVSLRAQRANADGVRGGARAAGEARATLCDAVPRPPSALVARSNVRARGRRTRGRLLRARVVPLVVLWRLLLPAHRAPRGGPRACSR